MQVTRAAFQAVASLNEQATDPKSHTLVRTFYTRFSSVPLPANSDGRHSTDSGSDTLLTIRFTVDHHVSGNKGTLARDAIIPFIGRFINLVFGVDGNCEIAG